MNLPTIQQNNSTAVYMNPLSSKDVIEQTKLIQEVMTSVMKEGTHFGKIPGCGDKDVLYKAGAEKLSLTFRLLPSFKIERRELPGGHREYEIVCSLSNQGGQFMGEGVGCCSTMESKYRYRSASRKCPKCNKETIIKGKEEYGGGFLCFAKKGGCGAKFADNAPEIVNQPQGQTENADTADQYNTVLKMAKKRAHVDAVISATCTSDIFTQDLEELQDLAPPVDVSKSEPPSKPTASAPAAAVAAPKKKAPPVTNYNNVVVEQDGSVVNTNTGEVMEDLSDPAVQNLLNAFPGSEVTQTMENAQEGGLYLYSLPYTYPGVNMESLRKQLHKQFGKDGYYYDRETYITSVVKELDPAGKTGFPFADFRVGEDGKYLVPQSEVRNEYFKWLKKNKKPKVEKAEVEKAEVVEAPAQTTIDTDSIPW